MGWVERRLFLDSAIYSAGPPLAFGIFCDLDFSLFINERQGLLCFRFIPPSNFRFYLTIINFRSVYYNLILFHGLQSWLQLTSKCWNLIRDVIAVVSYVFLSTKRSKKTLVFRFWFKKKQWPKTPVRPNFEESTLTNTTKTTIRYPNGSMGDYKLRISFLHPPTG